MADLPSGEVKVMEEKARQSETHERVSAGENHRT